jgi:putative DNA primase/helicase
MDKENEESDKAQKTIEHLASLAPFMYEQQRMSMAEKFGIRVSVLDQEVEKIRKANSPNKTKSLVEELKPWPEPVSGSEILDTVFKIALDYVVMPEKSAIAFSLWVLLTYSYDTFRILPILGIVSPEKRCGKTRLLEILSGLAYRAFSSCNLTPATVYRVIEKCHPCLLIDEADTFLLPNEELRGVINSGHSVKNAFVTRINPDTMEPERFSTWGPKAIALIGKLPGTLEDRSICISLERKLPTEKIKRLGLDFDDEYLALRRKCLRWAFDSIDCLKAADPQLPPVDNDRTLDNWSPLLAIADLIGGSWPEKARDAMVKIEAVKEDDSARVILLQDIQKVFAEHDCERLWTQNLVDVLVAMEDRPWGEWKRGKPLSGVSLSRLLKPFGIKPIQLKEDGQNKRGYEFKQFKDVLERYTPQPHIPNRNATPLPSFNHEGFRENQNATPGEEVAGGNRSKPASIAKGSGVAPWNGGTGGEDTKEPDATPKPEQGEIDIW